MTFWIAVICLLAGLGAGFFALRPRAMQALDVAVDMTDSSARKDFSLSRSLLLIGPEMNDAFCKEQRRELKRILGPLLEAEFKIIEIYGELPPAENGEPYDWLDNPLMRKTLNAEEGFHLIHVNREGKTSFHSGRVITAEALLHIFDLWDFITEDAGENLTNVSEEDTSELVVEDQEPYEQLAAIAAEPTAESVEAVVHEEEGEFDYAVTSEEIPSADEYKMPELDSVEPDTEEYDTPIAVIADEPPLSEEQELVESLAEAVALPPGPNPEKLPPTTPEMTLVPPIATPTAEECKRAPKSISQAIKRRKSASG